MTVRTHLELQQREQTVEIFLNGLMLFVPFQPENFWQEDPSKIQQGRKSGKWLKVEFVSFKGIMEVTTTTGSTFFQANIRKFRRLVDAVNLEELPESCEQTVERVL